jgi:hypothetical protein
MPTPTLSRHVPPELSQRGVMSSDSSDLVNVCQCVIQFPVVVRIDGEEEKTGFRSVARVARGGIQLDAMFRRP